MKPRPLQTVLVESWIIIGLLPGLLPATGHAAEGAPPSAAVPQSAQAPAAQPPKNMAPAPQGGAAQARPPTTQTVPGMPQSQAPTTEKRTPTRDELLQSVQEFQGNDFDPLLKRWEREFGSKASDPLFAIALDPSLPERARYASLMGAIKFSGPAVLEDVVPLIKDPSFTIRFGVALATRLAGFGENLKPFLPLLTDSAMFVRDRALLSFSNADQAGSAHYATVVLNDPQNFPGRKILPIVSRALTILKEYPNPLELSDVRKICAVFYKRNNPVLREDINSVLSRSGTRPPATAQCRHLPKR